MYNVHSHCTGLWHEKYVYFGALQAENRSHETLNDDKNKDNIVIYAYNLSSHFSFFFFSFSISAAHVLTQHLCTINCKNKNNKKKMLNNVKHSLGAVFFYFRFDAQRKFMSNRKLCENGFFLLPIEFVPECVWRRD